MTDTGSQMSAPRPVSGVSVVVPVYNNEQTLDELARRIVGVLEASGTSFEALLVDDDSSDGSWRAVRELAARHASVRGVRLMRNYGQHSAVLAGIRRAVYPVIVTLDADLQHRPEDMLLLLAKLGEGYDVVYGAETGPRAGLWRAIGSGVTRLVLQGAMGVHVARHISNFRAFRTPVREAFARYSSPFVSVDMLLSWGTARFAMVPVRRDLRAVGRSSYTVGKLVAHSLNMATGFSTVPLRLASLIGFAFTAFGLVVLAFVVVAYVTQGGSVPGFAFLASLVAIMSGAQLFALGIVGEYIARMHIRSMQHPSYVERETTEPPATEIV